MQTIRLSQSILILTLHTRAIQGQRLWHFVYFNLTPDELTRAPISSTLTCSTPRLAKFHKSLLWFLCIGFVFCSCCLEIKKIVWWRTFFKGTQTILLKKPHRPNVISLEGEKDVKTRDTSVFTKWKVF